MKSYSLHYLCMCALFIIASSHGMDNQITPYLNTGKVLRIASNPTKEQPARILAKMAGAAPIIAPLLIIQDVRMTSMVAATAVTALFKEHKLLEQTPALIARTIPHSITSTLVGIPLHALITRYVSENPYVVAPLQTIGVSISGAPNAVVNALTNAHLIPPAPLAENNTHLGAQYVIGFLVGMPTSHFTRKAVDYLLSDDEKKIVVQHKRKIIQMPETPENVAADDNNAAHIIDIDSFRKQLKNGVVPAISSWKNHTPVSEKDTIEVTFKDSFEYREDKGTDLCKKDERPWNTASFNIKQEDYAVIVYERIPLTSTKLYSLASIYSTETTRSPQNAQVFEKAMKDLYINVENHHNTLLALPLKDLKLQEIKSSN